MREPVDFLSVVSPADALLSMRAWIRSERQRAGWTQAELSRRSGVPAASISRLEQTGLSSTESLFKIVFALNRLDSLQDFLTERLRLANLPKSLDETLRKHPIQRVRMQRRDA